MERTLNQIAKEIRMNWTKVNYGAEPYLSAMSSLNSIHDKYYMDDAKTIVLYFLSNAGAWKGDKAKEIKNELKQMLKN
jgi:hypothetical protein